MSWRPAKSLVVLRDQINQAYPNRSKARDGLLGDSRHKATASDHNENAQGVVCAFDLTHDPANGLDAHALADYMRIHRHPDLKYIVSKDRICSKRDGWIWRKYSGDYHGNHIHVSVGVGPDGHSVPPYDDTVRWQLLEGENMSSDALTKAEVIELHNAYFGGNPGSGYDYRHVGGPLQTLIHDWKASGATLKNQVNTKKLIKPSECPASEDNTELYNAQIAATKKVFGK